jgi:hypothetical protein
MEVDCSAEPIEHVGIRLTGYDAHRHKLEGARRPMLKN